MTYFFFLRKSKMNNRALLWLPNMNYTCGILVVGFRVESLGDHGWPPLVTVSLTDPSIFLCLGCHQLSHMKQAISLRSSHCSVASYLWFVWYCGEIVIKTMLESFH